MLQGDAIWRVLQTIRSELPFLSIKQMFEKPNGSITSLIALPHSGRRFGRWRGLRLLGNQQRSIVATASK
jgi:hypothetical protein